jgi:CHAT domain-containing protein/Tfp pilus assembly protein PilF
VGKEMLGRGEYEEGIALCRRRLALPGIGDRDKLEIQRILALFYWYSDQSKEADKSCQRAFEIATRLGLREEAASIERILSPAALFVYATELKDKGDIPGSNQIFEEAWRKSQLIGNRDLELKILRTWSTNYLGTPNSLKKYRDLNIKSFELTLSLKYKVEASRAARNIGTYYFMTTDFSQALSFYLRALYYVRDLATTTDIIICLNNIASIYIALGDYAKAYDYLSEAIEDTEIDSSRVVRPSLLINLGQTFLSLARRFQTPEYYGQAMECFTSYQDLQTRAGGRDIDLHVLNGITAIYVDQGRLDEARAVLLPAVERLKADKTSALSGMTLLNLAAIALKSGQVSEAERYFGQALAASKQTDDHLQLIKALYGLGRCSELLGRDDQAIAFYGESIRAIADSVSSIVNDTDLAEFISRSRDPFQALTGLYYRLSRKGRLGAFEREIFRVAESFRARSFLEQLERQAHRADSGRTEITPSEEDRLAGERLNLLRQLSQGAGKADPAQMEDLESRIRHIDEMLDASVFEKQLRTDVSGLLASPVSLKVLQSSALPERTALIEYYLGDERSFLMCVTKNDFHLVELPSARSIEDSLAAYLSFLEDPSLPAEKGLPASRRLYAELLRPAADYISGQIDQLVIIPDGILFRLPFETLALEASSSSPAAYLNDRYTISYSPSASSLFYLRQRPKRIYRKEALAFGVSKYEPPERQSQGEDIASASSVLSDLYRRNGFTIGPIPYSQTEIKGLKRRIRPEGIDIYFGENATEAAFKGLDLEAYRLIHLACHAFSDERYPLRSSLVFSPGGDGEEDGFLQVSEMYRIRTNADLVVLSACQTGRGKIVRNEGILGLPRIFFYMGARSVVSTLWPIQDKAGALFMRYFYDSYYRGEGKAEALQTAKKKMIGSKYGHPYYWGAYTLTGEF